MKIKCIMMKGRKKLRCEPEFRIGGVECIVRIKDEAPTIYSEHTMKRLDNMSKPGSWTRMSQGLID